MAVPTVRPCLPQKCVCRNTNCGITQTESAWKPRTSSLSFKRLLWSPTLRKGDWDIAQISNQIESLKDNCLNCPVSFCEFRPMEISPPSPVFFKVKKTHEVSTPSQNGELAYQKNERKQHSHSQPSQQIHQTLPVQPHSQQSHSQSTSSDAGGSESEGGSLPPSFPDEDPERMKHSKISTCLLKCSQLYASSIFV